MRALEKQSTISGKELTVLILKLLGAGVLVFAVVAAPGLGLVYKYFHAESIKEKRRLARKMYELEKRGYIEKQRGSYRVSEKGATLVSEDELWSLEPPKKQSWDGKWRGVLFDIPGKKERGRQALRARLAELGFKRFQNSVFIHKENMRNILEPFCKFYGLQEHVRFVTFSNL